MHGRDAESPVLTRVSTVAALLLVGFMVGAGLVTVTPEPSTSTVPDGVAAPSPDGSSLLLASDDARYLDRIYREQTTEVVYCGLLHDRRLEPWLARLVATSPHGATFSAEDCPPSPDGVVNIHTHPGGATALSPADEVLLRERGYSHVCVQSGPTAGEPGTEADALTCYILRDGSPVEVPVVLVGPRQTG